MFILHMEKYITHKLKVVFIADLLKFNINLFLDVGKLNLGVGKRRFEKKPRYMLN